MTIERVIHYNGEIDLFNLQQIRFSETDRTSETTDMDVSKMLVDSDGNILVLIEVLTIDFYPTDDANNTKGCYIKRFEFAEAILDKQPFIDFIKDFVTSVRYRMVWTNGNRFKAYYNYIWTQKNENEQCVIAEILELEAIHKEGGVVTYKGQLDNY